MDIRINDIVEKPIDPYQKEFNPFPGLRPFSTDESYLFFGREEQSEEVLHKLSKSRFVAIVGPSGSGKSSFIFSGLLPVLYGSYSTETTISWEVITARPGTAPLENIAAALLSTDHTFLQADPAEKLYAQTALYTSLKNNPSALTHFLSAEKFKNKNILILLDQFEELFRQQLHEAPAGKNENKQPDEPHTLINLLIDALEDKAANMYVVISMRSDFIGECARYPDLTRKINESYYLIPQMTQEQKQKAILGPVAVGGGQMTPRLVQQLLNDLGDNPDQLPILQHALMRTWSYWSTSHEEEPIDLKHYEAIGRMDEALSQHANEAFEELLTSQKRVCESIFKALTDKGGDQSGIRKPTKLAQLAAIAGTTQEEVILITDKFRQPGRALLTPLAFVPLKSDTIIDISHESLMRIWVRLKKWVEEEEEAVQMYLRLAEASAKYQIGQAALWRLPDLQLALNWLHKQKPTLVWAQQYDPAFERVMAFLEYSKKAYETEQKTKEILQKKELRRARVVAVILGLFAIISVGFLIFAVTQQIKAREQAEIAKLNEKQAKAQAALALASERNARNQRTFAEQQKLNAHRQEFIARQNERLAQDERIKAEASEQEARKQQQIALEQQAIAELNAGVAKEQTAIAIWEKNNAYNARLLSIAQAMSVKSLQVIDLNLKLLTAGQAFAFNAQYGGKEDDPYIYEGLYYAIKKSKEESFNNLKGHTDNVRALASTNSGNFLYSAGSDGRVIQWSAKDATQAPVIVSQQKGIINRSIALSADNKQLAVGGEYPYIQLYNLQTENKQTQTIKTPTKLIWYLTYTQHADGIIFADSSSVYLYDFSKFTHLYQAASKINAISVSPQGNTMAIGNQEGQVILLNLHTRTPENILLGSKDPITAIAYNNKGNLLAIGDSKGTVSITEVTSLERVATLVGHTARINNIKFSWNDTKLATGSWDKTVRLWNATKWNNLPITLKDHSDWVWSLTFSPGDEKLLAGCRDSFVRIWPTNAKQLAGMLCEKSTRNMSKQEWEQFVADTTDVPYEKTCPALPAGENIGK